VQYCTGIGRIYRQFVRSHANRWHPDVCPAIDCFDAAGDEQHHVPGREHHPLFEGQAKTGYGRIAFAVIRGGRYSRGVVCQGIPAIESVRLGVPEREPDTITGEGDIGTVVRLPD